MAVKASKKKTPKKASKPAKKAPASLSKAISAKKTKAEKAPKISAKDAAKLKAAESAKKILASPVEPFLSKWKPKNESFELGLDRFLEELGVGEKERPALAAQITEKVQTVLRKEPLTPAIEEQLFERFPRDRVHKLGSIFSMKPKTAIRLNYLKADLRGFGQSQIAQDYKIKRSPLSPWAFEVGKPDELRANADLSSRGLFEFQDESSQLLALLTNSRPGNRVLDLCANYGDNALAIAIMMRNKGSLFVYEADNKRLKIFREKAQRAGVDNYRIVSDSQIGEVKSLDVVLVEAPSSHLGELAYRPELKRRFHKEELGRLHKLQAALLREGARKLKLGGHLIYATTSLNKSENEAQLENFLKTSHSSYRLVPALQYMKDYVIPYAENFFSFKFDEKALAAMGEAEPFLMLSPDVHSCKGMFIAVIQRTRIST